MSNVIITCRFVLAFTCAGWLPSQYIKFCKFAGMCTLSDWYIRQGIPSYPNTKMETVRCNTHFTIYFVNKYLECVEVCAEESYSGSGEGRADVLCEVLYFIGSLCIPNYGV